MKTTQPKLFAALCLLFCAALLTTPYAKAQQPTDAKATRKTRMLYANLQQLASKQLLFGHQDADAYGVGWKAQSTTPTRSDVKDIVGQHPAVHGWDLGDLGQTPYNLDSVSFELMLNAIKETYRRGGISTISWHVDNPYNQASSWDKTNSVKHLLPGGSHHQGLLTELDHLAGFLKKCRVGFSPIPILLRPWHEHNGNWFWWGKGNCTEEEYIALWQFTVNYLRQKKGLHNLLFVFSPSRGRMESTTAEHYLYGYPGDEYVDIIGLDNYADAGYHANTKPVDQQVEDLIASLELIVDIAESKGKVAVLSETGQEGISHTNWFTGRILKAVNSSPKAARIAYVLVWRNANTTHHYAPYPGHPSEADFRTFAQDPATLLEDDLPNVYRRPKRSIN